MCGCRQHATDGRPARVAGRRPGDPCAWRLDTGYAVIDLLSQAAIGIGLTLDGRSRWQTMPSHTAFRTRLPEAGRDRPPPSGLRYCMNALAQESLCVLNTGTAAAAAQEHVGASRISLPAFHPAPPRCPSPRPRVRVSGCAPRWRRRMLPILEGVTLRATGAAGVQAVCRACHAARPSWQ